MKLNSNPPRIPLFQRGSVIERLNKPLFGKEGKGEICSANFGDTTLVSWNQSTAQTRIVIPGKLAIASATRNPGVLNSHGWLVFTGMTISVDVASRYVEF